MTAGALQLQGQTSVFFGILVHQNGIGCLGLLVELNEPLNQFLRHAATPTVNQLVGLLSL